jgi:hypothetical protein
MADYFDRNYTSIIPTDALMEPTPLTGMELHSTCAPSLISDDLAPELLDGDNLLIQPAQEVIYGETEVLKTEDEQTLNNDVLGQEPPPSDKIICQSCHKTFATKGSLTRHEERHPLCVLWQSNANRLMNPAQYEMNVMDLLADTKRKILNGEHSPTFCRYCRKEFKTIKLMEWHFGNSKMCNKFAVDMYMKSICSN